LGIKIPPNASLVTATQQPSQVVEVGEFPSPPSDQFVIETNPARAEAAEVEAINQTIRTSADESTVIFPVKLAAKAPPTRAKYACSCLKPNQVWGRPGLKITCEECNSSFKIAIS
jgi:hypothetical protein